MRPMLVILGVLVLWVGMNLGMNRSGPEVVPWRADLATAKAEAQQSSKPLLLYFTATWCGPCKEMKRSVFSRQEVAAALNDVVPVKIDIDRDPSFAAAHHVNAVPTFILIDNAGTTLGVGEGFMPASRLVDWVSKTVSKARQK